MGKKIKKILILVRSIFPVERWPMIFIQIFGIFSLVNLLISTTNFWYVYTIIGYICIMLLGVSACYHRLLSHKSFEVNRIMKCFMIWCGILSAQGSPIYWALIHRGYHHRFADTDKDLHSPKKGFWHSYIWWMFKIKQDYLDPKYVVDLLKDKDVVFGHTKFLHIFWLSNLVIFLIDTNIWLYGIILPAFIAFHSFSLNNSMNHSTKLGYKNYKTKDESMNVVWLWPLILGEAWHNNHHGLASDSNFGGRRWWELDPTSWLINIVRSDYKRQL